MFIETPGFASPEDCAVVIAAFERLQPEHAPVVGVPQWDGKIMFAPVYRTHEPIAADILQSWRRQATLLVEGHTGRQLYADNVHVVQWPTGMSMQPHQDDRHPDGSPHSTPWREWAGVIYLNDDFEGGELYFPDHPEMDRKPVTGKFAFFPGHWLHGVREVRSGTRYTAPNWFTGDASREDHSR